MSLEIEAAGHILGQLKYFVLSTKGAIDNRQTNGMAVFMIRWYTRFAYRHCLGNVASSETLENSASND